MRTFGIDLAAGDPKTAACWIDWESGDVELLHRPVMSADLVERVARADMTGIDVPLGWPEAFVTAVASHHAGHGWPRVDPDRTELRFRLTDLLLWQRGSRPLSVSSDLIGVVAMRGAHLQQMLADAGIAIDRSGTAGKIAEVYPAAALRTWGWRARGYKGDKNRAVLAELVTSFVAACEGRLATNAGTVLDGCDDDGFDAFVCAILARAVALGLTARPDAGQLELARREGWIHFPTAPLHAITG